MHLKAIHTSNLGEKPLNPIQLLNALTETSLKVIFPNCCVALRSYCTLPVTVAEAERSFSVLKRIKNYLRSTMCQTKKRARLLSALPSIDNLCVLYVYVYVFLF